MSYVRRYGNLVFSNNLRDLETMTYSIRNNTMNSLIIFSKYLGCFETFKAKLKNYGIKIHHQNTYESFMRILNTSNNISNNDLIGWIKEVRPKLSESENTFLKYMLMSGLRRLEAINSFNRIIEMNTKNTLNEYYDNNLNCLKHYQYREFIRGTKNCLITFIKPNLLNEIANSKPMDNRNLRYSLDKSKVKCRVKELRKYFATFMLEHGILEGEVNLLQGRINGILFKNYYIPKLSEIRDKVFRALDVLENQINK